MGKSEILMLLAGVALSIMLAMVAIPMFSSGQEMADRQQVQQEILAIKSSIPLIKAMEGDTNTITAKHIDNHMEGFKMAGSDLQGENNTLATYTITDNIATSKTITIIVTSTDTTKVDLTKFARLNDICDSDFLADGTTAYTPAASEDGKTLSCIMKR